MKTLFCLLTIAILSSITISGPKEKYLECFLPEQNVIPITPHGNCYLYFDGVNDFIRTRHLPELELLNPSNTVEISFRLKILTANTVQFIMSQVGQSVGWYLRYKPGDGCFYFGASNPITAQELKMYNAGDTNWHSYKMVFVGNGTHIESYKDGALIYQYNNINWNYTPSLNGAFGIGKNYISTSYGSQNIYPSYYLHGYFDDLLVKVNNNTKINVNFNWGGGQDALDSAGFFIWDRNYSDDPSNPNLYHFSFGAVTGADDADPKWITDNPLYESHYFPMGNGFSWWREVPIIEPLESWQANSVVYHGNLFVTGCHNRINGTPPSQGDTSYAISKWDAANKRWLNVGVGLDGYGLFTTVWNDKLVVCGNFSHLHDASQTLAGSIALWNDNSWSVLTGSQGTGVDNANEGTGIIFSATTFNNNLIVGGSFTDAGGKSAKRVAVWDGVDWNPLGSGFENGNVSSLVVFNNELYAGGDFQYSGNNNVSLGGLAKWNSASQTWSPIETNVPTTQRNIQVLYVYNSKLWVGGLFSTIDGVLCNGIGYYDGTSWHNISASGGGETGLGGSALRLEITDMVSDGTNLFVCGSFEKINGTLINKVGMFNGTSWCALGNGVDRRPEGLSLYNNKLIITGDLYSADGINCNNVVMYDFDSLNHSPIGIQENQIPVKFNLFQNYPNPFNPKTQIKFDLDKSAFVSLKVYDIIGREVAVLINENLSSGTHSIYWDASGFASGVYFDRIITGDNFAVKKMVLVK